MVMPSTYISMDMSGGNFNKCSDFVLSANGFKCV